VSIFHPKNRGGYATEQLRDVNFVAFGRAPGVTHVQAVVTDITSTELPGVETLLHPSEGNALFPGSYFWAVRVLGADPNNGPYTIALKNADDPTAAAMYTVSGITFATHLMAAGFDPMITYPLGNDQTCQTFAAYGTASPGGTPSGTMTLGGNPPVNGVNPVPGTHWVLYFNLTTNGDYTLAIQVSGVAAANSPQSPIKVSLGCN
jgi:hypothetical protein